MTDSKDSTERKAKGYKATLKDGREIYIPFWSATIALTNLSKAGKILGADNMVAIANNNKAAAIVSIMNAEDAERASSVVKHFVCSANIENTEINTNSVDTMFNGQLEVVLEIFTHVVCAQYQPFFVSGLAKEASQEKQ